MLKRLLSPSNRPKLPPPKSANAPHTVASHTVNGSRRQWRFVFISLIAITMGIYAIGTTNGFMLGSQIGSPFAVSTSVVIMATATPPPTLTPDRVALAESTATIVALEAAQSVEITRQALAAEIEAVSASATDFAIAINQQALQNRAQLDAQTQQLEFDQKMRRGDILTTALRWFMYSLSISLGITLVLIVARWARPLLLVAETAALALAAPIPSLPKPQSQRLDNTTRTQARLRPAVEGESQRPTTNADADSAVYRAPIGTTEKKIVFVYTEGGGEKRMEFTLPRHVYHKLEAVAVAVLVHNKRISRRGMAGVLTPGEHTELSAILEAKQFVRRTGNGVYVTELGKQFLQTVLDASNLPS